MSSDSDSMEIDLKKSFLIQHWELIVLFITIVFFYTKLRKGYGKIQNNNLNYDDEVIAGDCEKEEVNENDEELIPALEDTEYVPYRGAQISLKGGAQEFYEMMNNRRSIRKFSNKSVDIEILKKCIESAGTSPSGAHTEPWTFCLIKELV